MRHIFFYFIGAFIIISCNNAPNEIVSYEKTWVFVELEVTTLKDTFDYHYYGQISQRILDKLAYNENYKTLFMLTNVRYSTDSNEIKDYEDKSDKGIYFFRTQDIVTLEVLKKDPLYNNSYKSENDSLNTTK